jgi:hypothetical protein
VVAAALVLAPATAGADTATVTDGTGDLWQRTVDPATGDTVLVPATADVNIDVTGFSVTHTRKRLVVVATYADLVEDGDFRGGYWSYFRLPDGRYAASALDQPETPGADPLVYVTLEKKAGTGKFDKDLECAGVKVAWDYAAGTGTTSTPRSCFGSPRWVEFAGTSVGASTTPGSEYDWIHDGGGTDAGEPSYAVPTGPWTGRVARG